MRYFFYTLNPIKISDLSNNELTISVKDSFDSEIIVSYKNSSIKLVPDNGVSFISTMDEIKCFEILTPEDLSVLKYLYIHNNVLFYDEGYKLNIEYLDPQKEEIIYNNTLREYISDCMLHFGIVKDIKEINKHIMGDERNHFFNTYYIHVGMRERLKRMRRELFLLRIKNFFNNIRNIIFKILKIKV